MKIFPPAPGAVPLSIVRAKAMVRDAGGRYYRGGGGGGGGVGSGIGGKMDIIILLICVHPLHYLKTSDDWPLHCSW